MAEWQPSGEPHIGIIGCGSIGSLLAAHLTLAGRSVSVVDSWFRNVEEVRGHGVEIQAPDEAVRARVDAHNIDEVQNIARPLDVLLLAVKAYESANALALMASLIQDDTIVVPVQNGMAEEWIAKVLPRGRLVGCSVHVPAELTAPGRVTRYLPRGRRTFSLGAVGAAPIAPAQYVAELIQPAGDTEVVADLPAVKWAKLAVNTMTNAPAGLTGWTTKRLWSDPRSVPLITRAAGETLAVAEASGVQPALVFGRIRPELFHRALSDHGAEAELSAAMAEMAAERTGASESRPSLLQDVDRGRRTEVRYLNGFVVRQGATHGVPTPVNAALHDLVAEIDRGRLRKEPGNMETLRALVG
ncbi:ketopantoate reductase family protein [Amycolatopsis palatopharyngis]|uniref:ketopantoate reductase family protein n=1 Tax=Amycolatopsis palatopharyngis TaxID=187982 RepID=UPI0013BE8B53|nr:2-dehydropantoate 2-reductase [Amycolatopsis palatopharyngis]